jgi:hypothetical protein
MISGWIPSFERMSLIRKILPDPVKISRKNEQETADIASFYAMQSCRLFNIIFF